MTDEITQNDCQAEDDLTIVYMVAFEKGKDACAAEIARLQAELNQTKDGLVDLMGDFIAAKLTLGFYAEETNWRARGHPQIDDDTIPVKVAAMGPEIARLNEQLTEAAGDHQGADARGLKRHSQRNQFKRRRRSDDDGS